MHQASDILTRLREHAVVLYLTALLLQAEIKQFKSRVFEPRLRLRLAQL